MLTDNKLIFVYGTLKTGFHNNYLLQHGRAKLVEPERVVPGFQLWECGIPYMVPTDEPDQTVTGEVWEVTPECLSMLDMLEGHPDWYTRTVIDDEAGIEAYIMQDVYDTPVEGDWNKTGVYQR